MEARKYLCFIALGLIVIYTKECLSAISAKSVTLLSKLPASSWITRVKPTSGYRTGTYDITSIHSTYNGNHQNIKPATGFCGRNSQYPICIGPSNGNIKTTKTFKHVPGETMTIKVSWMNSINATFYTQFSVRTICPYDYIPTYFLQKKLSPCFKISNAPESVAKYSIHSLDFVSTSAMNLLFHLEINPSVMPFWVSPSDTVKVTVVSGKESCLKSKGPKMDKSSCAQERKTFIFSIPSKKSKSKIIIPVDLTIFDEQHKFVSVTMSSEPSAKFSISYSIFEPLSEKPSLFKIPLSYKTVQLVGGSYRSLCENPACVQEYENIYATNHSRLSDNCECCSRMQGLHRMCTVQPDVSITSPSLALKRTQNATFTCSAEAVYVNYTSGIKWFKDGKPAIFKRGAKRFSTVEDGKRISVVVFEIDRTEQQGYYSCSAEGISGKNINSRKLLLLTKDAANLRFTYEMTKNDSARKYDELRKFFTSKINQSFHDHEVNLSASFATELNNKSFHIDVRFSALPDNGRQIICNKLKKLQLSLRKLHSLETISYACCVPTSSNGPGTLVTSSVTVYKALNSTFKQIITKRCAWNATHGAQWLVENITAVQTSFTLEQLSKVTVSKSNSLKVSQYLIDAINRSMQTTGKLNVKLVIAIMEKIVGANKSPEAKIAKNLIAVSSIIMDLELKMLLRSQKHFSTCKRLLKLLQALADRVQLLNSSLSIETKNIALLVFEVNTKNLPGIFIEAVNDFSAKSRIEKSYISNPTSSRPRQASVYLNPLTLKAATAKTNSTTLRVSSFLFQNAKLFLPPPSLKVSMKSEKKEYFKRHKARGYSKRPRKRRKHFSDIVVSSKIISTSLRNIMLGYLSSSEEIEIDFMPMEGSKGHHSCVFWDFKAAGGKGNWSSKGCDSRGKVDGYHKCRCNHLTNFALLLDVDQGSRQLTKSEKKSLSIVTYIGCAISLFCLLITFITYAAFSNLRKKQPSQILMLLCISLMLMLVAFLAGSRAKNRTTCCVFGILIHYFLLTSFCWMAVEGINLYLCLVKIMKSRVSKFLLKCNLFAWGTPAVIVAITVAVTKFRFYGRREGELWICILHGLPFYLAGVLPVLIIMAMNCIILILVLRSLAKSSTVSKSNQLSNLTKVRIAIGCALLMGVTWTVGFFAVGSMTYVVQLVFCVLNSLQGLFIFIMYCARHQDVRNEWKKFLRLEFFTSTSATNKQTKDTKGSDGVTGHLGHGTLKSKPTSPKPASPKPVSLKPASPKPASPKPVSPKPASPKPVSPKPASPKPVSPKPASSKPRFNGERLKINNNKTKNSKPYDGAMLINKKKFTVSLPGDDVTVRLLRCEDKSSFKCKIEP